MDLEEATQNFYYDETSPSGLRWACDKYRGEHYKTIAASRDDIAGHKTKNGYWRVSLNKRAYLAHRVIFLISGGKLDGIDVDHIDGNTSNNKLENLRGIPREMNARNIAKRLDNSSGFTGVYFKRKRGHTYAVAAWSFNNKVISKSFSTNIYGIMEAFYLACKTRKDAISQLNTLGYGYTERHGK